MGYSEKNGMVRADFFKESGKWYTTEAINMEPYYNELLIHDAVGKAVALAVGTRLRDMIVVVLEPYHVNSHPIMMTVKSCLEKL